MHAGLRAQPVSTPASERISGQRNRASLEKQSLLNNLPFRNIGPRIMSGRVVDLAVNPANPNEFYVAFASGGLWHTLTNGQTFEPVFDREAVITIGAIAVRWTTAGNEIWVGTGEVNSSRSSYSGVGIFKSADGGKTWAHSGLEESHHIGKIILNPTDPNTAWVAVLGHLYTPNKERGVYKTIDGGKTWKQTLFIDENTGCVQLQADPSNTQTLYACMWYRTRKAWNFEESGTGSGIYKSIDGGETWGNISSTMNGLPAGTGFGRSGIAISARNPNTVYCVIDNQNHRPEENTKASDALTSIKLKAMDAETFLKLPDEKLSAYIKEKDFPARYTAAVLKEMVRTKKITVTDIVHYTEDANSLLFQTPIIGAEVYRSLDAGKHWTKQNNSYLNGLFNTYGYYFGQIVASPADENQIYTFGVPIIKSKDGGITWKSIDADNMHGDFHTLWINPANPKHLICGNDGGVNISYDDGAHWIKCNSIPTAQCYSVNTDNEDVYNVYAGLQDNNVWTGPNTGDESNEWHQSGGYPFKALVGGDGMQVQIDLRDNATVYTGYQFGNYFRVNKHTGQLKPLSIDENIGEEKLRWNWNTPILISKHSYDILYWGSNKLHRSLDKGETWQTISPDLTEGARPGDVAYGTLTSIDESALQFGLIYTGSDDGKIYVTKDGGSTWNEIGAALCAQLQVPKQLWVSRVIASSFAKGRVYATLNGYRNDHFKAYICVSEDFGAHWSLLSASLPNEPVNVLREDGVNENLLFAGSDGGVYVSLNRGNTWMLWNKGLPNVPVHDLVIQPKAKELVVGTHGRSIFIAGIDLIEKLNDSLMQKPLYSFAGSRYKLPSSLGKENKYPYYETTAPEIRFAYYAKASGPVTVSLYDSNRKLVAELHDTAKAGLNHVMYNYRVMPPSAPVNSKSKNKPAPVPPAADGNYYISKGNYTLQFVQGDAKTEAVVEFFEK